MSRLPQRFIEDRAMRDAARAVLAEDIEHLRTSLAQEGIASRVSSGVTGTITARIRTGARDVLAQAKAQAGDHKGVLAILVGALILWLARGPILDWIDDFAAAADLDDEPEPEPEPEPDRPAPNDTAQGDPA